MSKRKKKKGTQAVHVPQKKKMTVKADPTRRAMPPEELEIMLKDGKRGCGAHKSKKKYDRKREKKVTGRE